MNVVDSSAWPEYLADGPNAQTFAPVIEETSSLLVPVLCLYEVFKRVMQQRGESDALQAVAAMHQGTIVELDSSLALLGARLSVEHRLPMADALILATARDADAILWTQDADFEGLEGVRFVGKAAP